MLLAVVLLFLAFHLSAQTCAIYDPDLPPNPPSQLNFDIELKQVHGAAFRLSFKNFPLYTNAGYFIMKNHLDIRRTLAQQATPSNNVDMQTKCSLSTTDKTVVCADYSNQFTNSNYRVTKNGCNLNIEIDLTFEQFKSIATFNSVLGNYDLSVNIGYYTRSNIDGDVYWSQSNLAHFTVNYQKIGNQQDEPYYVTGSLSGRTLYQNSKCYAGYTASLQTSLNDTISKLNQLNLKVKDQGKMVDFSGCVHHNVVCSKKPTDLTTMVCEGYVSMRSDDMELTISNGGLYCALNPQKTACIKYLPFVTNSLSVESKCAIAKTEFSPKAFPFVYLSNSADLNSERLISSIGDTYILMPINAPRASFKATNVKFVFKTNGNEKDLISSGRAKIIADPSTTQIPAEYSDKVCIVIKLIDKLDGFFLVAERKIELEVTWDLVPRVASRAGEIAIDSQYSALIVPEFNPKVVASAIRASIGFLIVVMFLSIVL